ncbi:pentapeptide repeat-containing protein [Enterobacteriaceae bacterium H4N4]|uniref:Pentapeptide repeat-containing protein n=1 Tax=Silvania confinis TaxID=2926470 RepID=A0A9J6QDI5_9ENTR|nr:hypothetical protein [Silvania confinis]MCU6667386.1 pentapeptide repeat-containing protein [Silvania confinis]
MNLNAKRQGAMPLSIQQSCEQKSTITELKGLLESRHFARLHICEGGNTAIVYRSNLKQCLFKDVQFKSLLFNRCYIDEVCFENCDMANVFFSHCVFTKPIRLRECRVAGMRLLNMSLEMFIFEECTGVEQILTG